MGRYVPRIVSPITGQEEAAPDSERLSFPQDDANLGRWRTWWKRANLEQFVSFALIGGLAIIVFSLIAYSTVFQNPDLPDSSGFDFIALEADVLDDTVGQWFGTLFLAVGAVSLFAAALGIVDYVSRLVADVVHVGWTRDRGTISESRLYFTVVWTMVVFGSAILLLGFDQPLVLITISTVLGGAIMFVYTCLLLVTNRRYLPAAIQLRGYRRGDPRVRRRDAGGDDRDRRGRPGQDPASDPALPERALLGEREQPPAVVVGLPDIDVHVDAAAHVAEHAQRLAREGSVGEHRPCRHVDDLEAARSPRLGGLRLARLALGRDEERLAAARGLLLHLLERHHLGAGALRLRVEDPDLCHLR